MLTTDAFTAEATKILGVDSELSQLAAEVGVDFAGKSLNRKVEPDVDNASELPYWKSLKEEIRELLCESSGKYAEIRKRMAQAKDATEKVGIPTIAATVGASLGLEAALLTPYISLIFLAVAKLSVQSRSRKQAGQLLLADDGTPMKLQLGDIGAKTVSADESRANQTQG